MRFLTRARARPIPIPPQFQFLCCLQQFSLSLAFRFMQDMQIPKLPQPHTHLSWLPPSPTRRDLALFSCRSWQAFPAIPFKSAFLRLDCIIKVNNWLRNATERVLRVKNRSVFKIFQMKFNIANVYFASLSYTAVEVRGFSVDLLICCGLLTRWSTTLPGISFLCLTT